jgi:hypothetical protein
LADLIFGKKLRSGGSQMKELPVSVADFSEISQGDYLYADKTELIYRLVRFKKSYFLSRPRRFGKSLLVSTLKSNVNNLRFG